MGEGPAEMEDIVRVDLSIGFDVCPDNCAVWREGSGREAKRSRMRLAARASSPGQTQREAQQRGCKSTMHGLEATYGQRGQTGYAGHRTAPSAIPGSAVPSPGG